MPLAISRNSCIVHYTLRKLYLILLLINPGLSSTIIINKTAFDEGVCQGEEIHLRLAIGCDMNTTSVLIDGGPSDRNEIAWCLDFVHCHKGNYSEVNKVLQVNFVVNYKQHIGNYLVSRITCQDGTPLEDRVRMVPCKSGFERDGTRNDTHVSISCEHVSYKLSSTGMMIIDHGNNNNTLATCRWNNNLHKSQCVQFSGTESSLKNGMHVTLPYEPDMTVRCVMDGQSVEVNIIREQVANTGGQEMKIINSPIRVISVFLVIKFYIL